MCTRPSVAWREIQRPFYPFRLEQNMSADTHIYYIHGDAPPAVDV